MMKLNIVSGVYLIQYTPTGDTYIGSSFNIHHRFEQHMMSRSKWFTSSSRDDYSLFLLRECSNQNLKVLEQEYLDKYSPSLNKNLSTTLPPVRRGESNNNASYDKDTYVAIFKNLALGIPVQEVSDRLNVSKDVVKRIYSLKSHTYLHEEYLPEYYALLKVREEALKQGKVLVFHPDHGEYVLSRPFKEFCDEFNLPNNGGINRLYNGTRKSYYGWKIKEKV